MSGEQKKETKAQGRAAPRVRTRILRRLAWGFLWGALLLGLSYSQRSWMLAPGLKAWASGYAREQLGAELGIGDLAGSWIGGLELSQMSWSAEDSPLVSMQGAELKLAYSLRALFFGDQAGLENLEFSARDLELDLDRWPSSEPNSGQATSLPRLDHFKLQLHRVKLRGLGTQAPLLLDEILMQGSLVDGVLRLSQCSLRRGEDRVSLSRLHVDLEGASAKGVLSSLAAELRVELQHPEELWAGGLLPPGLVLDWSGTVAEGRLNLEGELRMQGGHLRIERGGILLPAPGALGRGAWWRELQLDLDLAAEFEQLAALGPLLGDPLGGVLDGQLKLRGTLGDPQGTVRAELREFVSGALAVDLLQLDLEARQGRVLIRSVGAKDEHFQAQLKGMFLMESASFESLDLVFRSSQLEHVHASLPAAENVLLEVALQGALVALQGSYRLNTGSIPLGGQDISSLAAEGSIEDGVLRLSSLRALTANGSIEAAGELRPLSAAELEQHGLQSAHYELLLTQLRAESGALECALAEEHRSILGAEHIICKGMRLVTRGGQAQLDLEQDSQRLRVDLNLEDFDPKALLATLLPEGVLAGSVSGELHLELPADQKLQPRLQVALAGSGLTPLAAGPRWDWKIAAEVDKSRLKLQELQASSSEGAVLGIQLSLPFHPGAADWMAPGAVELNLALEHFDLKRQLAAAFPSLEGIEGEFNAVLKANGAWDALGLEFKGGLSQARLPAVFMDLGGRRQQLAFDLACGAGAQRLELDLKGAIQANLLGALGWDGDVHALWNADTPLSRLSLSSRVELQIPELAWLAKWAPSTRGAEGALDATLDLQGPLSSLSTTGALSLHGASMRLSAELPPLRALELDVVLDERLAMTLSGSGELGAAPFTLQGAIQAGQPVPTLDLHLQGQNLLLVRNAEMRLRAGLDLALQGPLDQLKITGSVEMSEGQLVRNMDLLNGLLNRSRSEASAHSGIGFSLAHEGPLANAAFDVDLTASRAFRLNSNLAQIFLLPELKLTGSGEVPIFIGSLYITPSTLNLPSGRLHVRSGHLEFLPSDPFEPVMTIEADVNAQGYRVQASFGGTLSQPEITLSSQPPLASDELMLLFLTGRKPSGTSNQALQSVAIYLANDFLSQWLFAKDVDSAEGYAERFDYETGASLSKSGRPTGRATFLLHERREGPGRSYYLVGDRDPFDRLNYGVGILFRFR